MWVNLCLGAYQEERRFRIRKNKGGKVLVPACTSTVPLSMRFPTEKVSVPGYLSNSRTEKVSVLGVSVPTSPPAVFWPKV